MICKLLSLKNRALRLALLAMFRILSTPNLEAAASAYQDGQYFEDIKKILAEKKTDKEVAKAIAFDRRSISRTADFIRANGSRLSHNDFVLVSQALMIADPDKATSLLIDFVGKPENSDRLVTAVNVISSLPVNVDKLAQIANDKKIQGAARIQASFALAEKDDKRATGPLVALLEDKKTFSQAGNRKMISRALAKVGDENTVQELNQMKGLAKGQEKERDLAILGIKLRTTSNDEDEQKAFFVEYTSSKYPEVRNQAMSYLEWLPRQKDPLNQTRYRGILEKIAKTENHPFRSNAAQKLKTLKN